MKPKILKDIRYNPCTLGILVYMCICGMEGGLREGARESRINENCHPYQM